MAFVNTFDHTPLCIFVLWDGQWHPANLFVERCFGTKYTLSESNMLTNISTNRKSISGRWCRFTRGVIFLELNNDAGWSPLQEFSVCSSRSWESALPKWNECHALFCHDREQTACDRDERSRLATPTTGLSHAYQWYCTSVHPSPCATLLLGTSPPLVKKLTKTPSAVPLWKLNSKCISIRMSAVFWLSPSRSVTD